ncbi:MAG: hypothetical protein ABIA37_03890, partial [Candidatus Woesearchaeota archaeon]
GILIFYNKMKKELLLLLLCSVLLLACQEQETSVKTITSPVIEDTVNNYSQQSKENTPLIPSTQLVEITDLLGEEIAAYPTKNRNKPNVGESWTDPDFHTKLTRVTTSLRHEYSRFDPFNEDHSLIILYVDDTGDFNVYETKSIPYENNLVMQLKVAEPRWINKETVYGLDGFKIMEINVNTRQRNILKDFSQDQKIAQILNSEPDLYRITTREEGEASLDNRYWTLILQGSADDYRPRYIFTWNRQTDKILGIYKIPQKEANIDWVGMSPLGNYVIIGADEGNGGNLDGLVIANKELTQFHQLARSTAHSDTGLDSTGKEVIVMQNSQTDYIDLIPLDFFTNPVNGDYSTSTIKRLARLYYASDSKQGFNSGLHISCNAPGYCLVSTYLEPGQKEQNWLDNSLVLIKLDPEPKGYYLAKTRSVVDSYWEEVQATLTKDGTKAVWTTNWGNNPGQEKIFLMQVEIPN